MGTEYRQTRLPEKAKSKLGYLAVLVTRPGHVLRVFCDLSSAAPLGVGSHDGHDPVHSDPASPWSGWGLFELHTLHWCSDSSHCSFCIVL